MINEEMPYVGEFDIGKLDQKSVKIMVMLMVHLLNNKQTTEQFFQDVIFEQAVEMKDKEEIIMTFMKSDDFFRVLKEQDIREKNKEHPNLREFLQLNEDNPNLLMVKKIQMAL